MTGETEQDTAAEHSQAEGFRRTRAARSAALAEDYCELIADLIAETGQARAVDIARRLGVAHPTVVKAIGRLKRDGLVHSEPYRSVFLTQEGQRQAEAARRRHLIVQHFLEAVGVSPETARRDAEGIEHHVSEETLEALARATRRLRSTAEESG